MNGQRVDFPKLSSMTFFEPDRAKFRCLQIAFDVLSLGGTAPAAMNAANEVAVEAFLNRNIPFGKIPGLIEKAVRSHKNNPSPELDDIIEADIATRKFVRSIL
jgi:1-deoxy-D-xylulose-5-phosphate reductoisomerase